MTRAAVSLLAASALGLGVRLLTPSDDGTELLWHGELGTDAGAIGEWWGARVARVWTGAVEASMHEIAVEAERRARAARPRAER